MVARNRRGLKIEWLPLERLKPDPANPRRHGAQQIRQIARSIEKFGFNAPILIDRDDTIVAGHGRVLASQLLGRTEIPVILIEHLTPAQASAYAIADNRLAELASWDDRLLGERLRDLAAVDLDLSLEVTGFTMAEIDLRIEQSSPASGQNKPDQADELPSLTEEPPVTQPGDLWCLDRHRILCGDALDRSAYRLLMDGSKAHAVFTDPPYNVPISGHVSGGGSAIANSQWLRETWTGRNTPDFCTRASRCSCSIAQTGRCTSSAWIGATS